MADVWNWNIDRQRTDSQDRIKNRFVIAVSDAAIRGATTGDAAGEQQQAGERAPLGRR
jgi:hypothetical protein